MKDIQLKDNISSLTTKNPSDITSKTIKNVLETTNKDIEKFKNLFPIASGFNPNDGLIPFKIFDESMLKTMEEKMKVHDEKRNSFGRKNSQTTISIMTLQMMNERNPYRLLRQIAAQLEAKRPAVKEWYFKLLQSRNEIELWCKKIQNLENKPNLSDQEEYSFNKYKIDVFKKMSEIQDGMIYIEGALKEIATLQNQYEQICETHSIPIEWGEKEFEQNEIGFHKRRAFVLALRDLQVNGLGNHGTQEYMEQFGINPIQGYKQASDFLKECKIKQDKNIKITEKMRDDWLDKMEEEYKDSHLYILEKMGIINLIDENIQFKSKPVERKTET